MSAPVDVLGALDQAIERNIERGAAKGSPSDRSLREARAAVSALIGVAQSGKREGDAQERRQWLVELDAALARVQGGA